MPPEVVHLTPALGPGVCMSVAQGTCSKDYCTGGGARRKCEWCEADGGAALDDGAAAAAKVQVCVLCVMYPRLVACDVQPASSTVLHVAGARHGDDQERAGGQAAQAESAEGGNNRDGAPCHVGVRRPCAQTSYQQGAGARTGAVLDGVLSARVGGGIKADDMCAPWRRMPETRTAGLRVCRRCGCLSHGHRGGSSLCGRSACGASRLRAGTKGEALLWRSSRLSSVQLLTQGGDYVECGPEVVLGQEDSTLGRVLQSMSDGKAVRQAARVKTRGRVRCAPAPALLCAAWQPEQ